MMWGFGKSEHGSIVQSGGIFFFTYSVACSIRTRHKTTAPLMSVSLPAAVDVFKLSKTRPDNCWKPTVWRSVGAADRWLTGMYVIKGKREGISAWTEWLWSGCGRPAVTGHIWPMAHSWTLMSGCQVSERSPVGALHCWYHFLAVYMNSCLILRGITTLLQTPSPTLPHHLYTRLPTTTQTMIDSSVLMRQCFSQETIQ